MTQNIGTPTLKVQGIAGKLAEITAQNVQGAMMASNSTNKCDAVYIGTFGLMSGIHVLASLLGRCAEGEDEREPGNHVNRGSLLLAAIMVAEFGAPVDEGFIRGEFSPHKMIEAVGLVEKILGECPDKYLDEQMISGAREIVANGAADGLMSALKSGNVVNFSSGTRH